MGKYILKKAGLLESPRRSYIVITDAGSKVLTDKLNEITIKYLERFPEFVAFKNKSNSETTEIRLVEEEDKSEKSTRRNLGG